MQRYAATRRAASAKRLMLVAMRPPIRGGRGAWRRPFAMSNRTHAVVPASGSQLPLLSIFDSVGRIFLLQPRDQTMPSSYVIGDHFEAFIKEQIETGRYASASEVVRDGLRALEERERLRAAKLAALRAEIQRGADSGAGVEASVVFSQVRKRVAQAAAARTRRR